MLKKKRELNILNNKVFGWNIHGEIKKIHIKCNNVPVSARLEVFSEEGEKIHDNIISKSIENIYPKNIISETIEVPGVINYIEVKKENGLSYIEEVPTPPVFLEQEVSVEDFYVVGNVAFKVTGLQEGEKIDDIRLVYKEEAERSGL